MRSSYCYLLAFSTFILLAGCNCGGDTLDPTQYDAVLGDAGVVPECKETPADIRAAMGPPCYEYTQAVPGFGEPLLIWEYKCYLWTGALYSCKGAPDGASSCYAVFQGIEHPCLAGWLRK